MKTIVVAAALALLVGACGGTEPAAAPTSRSSGSPTDSPTVTTTAPPSTSVSPSAVDLPDNPGPSRAPVGSRNHLGKLNSIWVYYDGGIGQDIVWFTFSWPDLPRCTVRRVLDLPRDRPWVDGSAFLIVRCAPAVPVDRSEGLSFSAGGDWGQARNVTEVVLTRADHRAMVWTIGLRHAAGWAVGGGGGDMAGPIVMIEE